MCDINTLLKLCDNDSRLLGAIQELKNYRENPITNMQPCWQYVQQNSCGDQLQHVLEEINEALEEKNYEKMLVECFDVLQSAITLMYILKTKYGTNLTALISDGTEKNRIRGYYYKPDSRD